MALTADATGRLAGTFRVPAGIPVGAKSVTFKGTNSSAQAIYRAEGWKTTQTWGRIETTVTAVAIGVDPLGEVVITLPYDALLTGIDIWPTVLGDRNKPIIVQLRGVEGGYPSREVYAEKFLSGDALKTGQWLGFDFATPVLWRAGTPFAFVVLTEDAEHSIAYAQLGGFDNRPGRGWLTGNPFTLGTAVSSADAFTWLAHPDRDLTFRLRAVKVTEKTRKFTLGIIDAERVSDLMTFMTALRPEGTEVELEFIMPNGQRYTAPPESALALPDYFTGDITVNVTLTGTDRMTPILLPDAQIMLGTIAETANYISRFMDAGPGMKQKVVLDTETPGNSSVTVRVHTGGTIDAPVWADAPLVQAVPLGDGKVENEWGQPVDCPETCFEVLLAGGPAGRLKVTSPRGVTIPNI